jgi:hypothetical protein
MAIITRSILKPQRCLQEAATNDRRMVYQKRPIRGMENEFEFLPLAAWNP